MARGRYNQSNGYSIGYFFIFDFNKNIVHFSKDFFVFEIGFFRSKKIVRHS